MWSQGLIFPLFKGGPDEFKLDPNKYRGITLLSIIGKTYTSILNKRIYDFVETNNILVDEQAGFRRNRSTTDQIFILTEIIRNRRPRRTFAAFIDVAKAYDKVWRDGLWYKLWKSGIRGKMWRTLKNMYHKVESCILLGDNRTDFFTIQVGVRQGCILSPILFILFINDLCDAIKKLNKGVAFGGRYLSILFFADDIVILAETKDDLEAMLLLVYEYSLKWRCKFNFDKCGVVIFDNHNAHRDEIKYGSCKNTCSCGHHFSFGPFLINEVLMYKYLGIELDYKLSFTDFKNRLLTRARSNMGRIFAMGIRDGYLSVKGSINLYQALVRSILEYSCEIWGFDKFEDAEKIQWDMGKRILRCPTKTTNAAVTGDLGWWTLQGRRNLKKLIYWRNIFFLPDSNLRKQVYLFSRNSSKKSSWAHSIRNLLEQYGASHLFYNPDLLLNIDAKGNNEAKNISDHKKYWKTFITSKILADEEKKWHKEMNKRSKLRTYQLFKKKLCFEKYLSSGGKTLGRHIHTSLRNGANCLEIERGRWANIPAELRLCRYCDLQTPETELHFVTSCPRYRLLRIKLFKLISEISGGKWCLDERPVEYQFLILMAGSGDEYENKIFAVFQNYLVKFMKLRNPKLFI